MNSFIQKKIPRAKAVITALDSQGERFVWEVRDIEPGIRPIPDIIQDLHCEAKAAGLSNIKIECNSVSKNGLSLLTDLY